MKRPLRSIQLKVFLVIFGLTWVVVAPLTGYFAARHTAYVRQGLERKAATYALVVSEQVGSALAFEDQQTAREVFAAMSGDQDVRALALYRSTGELFHLVGELSAPSVVPRVAPGAVVVDAGPGYVRAVTSVPSKERAAGTLVVELGTEGVEVERRLVRRVAALAGFGALAVGFAAAWLVARSLGRRLGAIAAATTAVARGDLTGAPLEDASADEVGQLARAFNAMVGNIQALLAQLRQSGERDKERLDELVRQKTRELGVRNDDMRLVLDHVAEGLCTVDRAGVLSPERSAALARWFGPAAPGETLWDYVGRVDPGAAAFLRTGWELLAEDIMPREVILGQLPTAVQAGPRQLRLGYLPIEQDGALSRILVVISDVTDEVERDRGDAAQRELLGVFERVVGDHAGFVEFHAEAEALVTRIASARALTPELRRWIHTLKGNAAVFGMPGLTGLCHAMESRIAQTGEVPGESERAALSGWWHVMSAKVAFLLGEVPFRIEIDETDYAGLVDAIGRGAPRSELARVVQRWRLEPAARRLSRVAQQARAIAAKVGKPQVRVVTEPNGVRLDAARWAPFWAAFVHAVRNAVDHGLETAEERRARGKAGPGTLTLRTCPTPDGGMVLEVADDGRGIDWETLDERGRSLGMPLAARANLDALLFHDGVSSKEHASEVSGRGVGMGAVRAACEALGGRVQVESTRGEGTVVRFRFGRDALAAAFEVPVVARSLAPVPVPVPVAEAPPLLPDHSSHLGAARLPPSVPPAGARGALVDGAY